MSGTSSIRLTENSLRGLNRSNNGSASNLDDRSIAERSINYMQTRQSTASVGSRAARRKPNMLTGADKIFSPEVKSRASKVTTVEEKLQGDTEDAPYFQRRLMKNSRRRGGSHVETGYSDRLGGTLEPRNNNSHLD